MSDLEKMQEGYKYYRNSLALSNGSQWTAFQAGAAYAAAQPAPSGVSAGMDAEAVGIFRSALEYA